MLTVIFSAWNIAIKLLHMTSPCFLNANNATMLSSFPTGTHDIHALILGRAITGLQAFSAKWGTSQKSVFSPVAFSSASNKVLLWCLFSICMCKYLMGYEWVSVSVLSCFEQVLDLSWMWVMPGVMKGIGYNHTNWCCCGVPVSLVCLEEGRKRERVSLPAYCRGCRKVDQCHYKSYFES